MRNISFHLAQLCSTTATYNGIRKTEHKNIDTNVLFCIIMEEHT